MNYFLLGAQDRAELHSVVLAQVSRDVSKLLNRSVFDIIRWNYGW